MRNIIISEEQLNQLIEQPSIMQEDAVEIPNTPNTMSFWHGGNLDSYEDVISQKSGRYQYGPGLYLTTKYDDAKQYAKGSRKLYLVTVNLGNDLENIQFSVNAVNDFIKKYTIRNKQSELLTRIAQRTSEQGTVPGFIMNNLIINFDAIKPANTKYLRQFFIDNGADYNIVDNAFGWGEKMMVLFNMNKIASVRRINPNDQITKFDLH